MVKSKSEKLESKCATFESTADMQQANAMELAVLNAQKKGARETVAMPAIKMHYKDERYPVLDPVKGEIIVDARTNFGFNRLKKTVKAFVWDAGEGTWCAPSDEIENLQVDYASSPNTKYAPAIAKAFSETMGKNIRACTATKTSTESVTDMRKILGLK
jgi:hypothetical protein